jgi:MraZ protein
LHCEVDFKHRVKLVIGGYGRWNLRILLGTNMTLFVGRHINKIDKKGRVSVPKPFRSVFINQSFNGLYLYPLFKFNAFEACDEAFIERMSDSLEDLPMFSDEQDDLSVILESTHRLPFDPEGRVALPKDVVRAAEISTQVLFVGRGRRFQIWDPKAYDNNRGQAFDRALVRGATLQLRQPIIREGEEL